MARYIGLGPASDQCRVDGWGSALHLPARVRAGEMLMRCAFQVLIGLFAATAALAASGYRASREAHHYRVFQSLEFTVEADPKLIRSLDAFRKKRNLSSYEMGGTVSDKEAKEMSALARDLRTRVERWIRSEHPDLL